MTDPVPPPDPEPAASHASSREERPGSDRAFGSADTMQPSPSLAATLDADPNTRGARPDELERHTPRGPTTDEVPEDVIDPLQMKLVLSRMFRRHQEAPPTIGRLRVLERLGAGGMGVVYAAYDDELDRKVAVKVLRAGSGRSGDTGRARLLREARAMARLTHPHVATVYEVGSVEDGVYLSMELIDGVSLDVWLRERERSWREVVDAFVAAGRGLAAAHRSGIIHRDFKPHNVMVGRDGVVKVLDFGLARYLGAEDRTDAEPLEIGDVMSTDLEHVALTRTGAVLGTPAYMAPEQYAALPTTDKSDQFSFCVALYQGLFGRLPFSASSLPELAAAVLDGRLLPIPSDSSVPPWVRRVVQRGLCPDPEQRHPSMDALLHELDRDPEATRRRIVGALAIAVTLGVGGFALARATEQTPTGASCDDASTELERAWNPERRAAIEAAFERAGAPGSEAWARVEPGLDAYADQWIAMRDEACRTHLQAKQSDSLFDLRSACLDRRRAGFDALTELLVEIEGGEVPRAPLAVAALPSIVTCGDTAALSDHLAPPENPQDAVQVQRRREQLARAKEHEDLGQLEPGLELVDEALEMARTLEYGPLEAEALLRRGSLLMESEDPQQAERTLSQAFLRAVAVDHHEVAVEALSKRMFMRGELFREVDRALEDRDLADAIFEQVPHAGRIRGVHLNNVGLLLHRDQAHAEAAATFDRALEVKREAFGPRHPEIAMTLANVGLLRLNLGDSLGARSALEDAVEIADEALGPSHPTTLAMSTLLAQTLAELGRLEDARGRLEEVRAAQHLVAGGRGPRMRDTLLALGDILLEERRYGEAREHFEAALEIARAHGGGYLAVQPLYRLGEAQMRAGEIEKGLEHARQAHRELMELVSEDDPLAISSRFLLLEGLMMAGRESEAEGSLPTCEGDHERALAEGDLSVVDELASIARWRIELGDPERALRSTTDALAALEEEGVRDGPHVADLLEVRGLARLEVGRPDDALEDLRRAERLRVAGGSEADAPGLAMTRMGLARALREAPTGDPAEAATIARRARAALFARGTLFETEVRAIDAWLER